MSFLLAAGRHQRSRVILAQHLSTTNTTTTASYPTKNLTMSSYNSHSYYHTRGQDSDALLASIIGLSIHDSSSATASRRPSFASCRSDHSTASTIGSTRSGGSSSANHVSPGSSYSAASVLSSSSSSGSWMTHAATSRRMSEVDDAAVCAARKMSRAPRH